MSRKIKHPSPPVPKWVRNGLADRRWFRDGKPQWTCADTAADARRERRKRVKFLRNKGRGDRELQALADRIERCRGRQRCLSGACPICGRAFKRLMVARTQNAVARMEAKREGSRAWALSVVPLTGIVDPAEFPSFDMTNARRRMSYALEQANVPRAIGGWDFSLDEDAIEGLPDAVSVHAYIIVVTSDIEAIRSDLARYFPKPVPAAEPRLTHVHRPIKRVAYDNDAWRASYAFKMQFFRRVTVEKTVYEIRKSAS